MWWGYGYGWEWMIFGGLMMLLFWGGLIAAAVMVSRAVFGVGSQQITEKAGAAASIHNAPLNVLKERYARGEITQAEYEEIRDDLKPT